MLIYFAINTPLLLGHGPSFLFQGVMYVNMILRIFSTKPVFLSRWPQIHLNFRNGDTGQMSILTQLQNQSGAIARIFTLFVSSTDWLYIVSPDTKLEPCL